MANWHNFEKDAAEYFERSHQVFAKLDSRTVEMQNDRLSTIAIKYSRVRISVRLGRRGRSISVQDTFGTYHCGT